MEIKHRLHPTIPARGRKMFVLCHEKLYLTVHRQLILKSASNLNGNLNCRKELEHYAS